MPTTSFWNYAIRFLALSAGLLLSGRPLHADATYIYTGNPFTNGSGSISGSFTTVKSLAPNLVDAAIFPISFSFTDGKVVITNKDIQVPGEAEFVDIATDSNGNITSWKVAVSHTPQPEQNGVTYHQMETCYTTSEPGVQGAGLCDVDESIVGEEFVSGTITGIDTNNPGTWQTVPEPSTIELLFLGIAGTLPFARNLRKRLGA